MRARLAIPVGFKSISLCALGSLLLVCPACRQKNAAKSDTSSAKAAELTSNNEPLLAGVTDFTKSNAVGCVLGGEEHENGILLAEKEKDGLSTIVKVGEESCRLISPRKTAGLAGYLYFSIDSAFKQGGVKDVKIEIEYFDIVLEGRPVSFVLQYDASGQPGKHAYATATPTIRLRGSEKWQTATFVIHDGTFQNGQNGHSDFRLRALPSELYVRRVSVSRIGDGQ